MILSRDQIINAKDFDLQKIEVPKWGGEVYIRPLSARIMDRLEVINLDRAAYKGSPRALILSGSLCDENGKLLFSEDDTKALAEKNSDVVDPIIDKIVKLNSLSDEDIQERAKN